MSVELAEIHNCIICGRRCVGHRSLCNHIVRAHKYKIADYIVEFLLKGEHPTCACGCHNNVVWNKSKRCFNRYITGHNATHDGFAADRQPKFTCEQVNRRNDAIRRAYSSRGACIKKKISDSLVVTFAAADVRQRLSSSSRRYWSKPGSRAQASMRQTNAWSGQKGAERRARVFTAGFAKKISDANMRRNFKHESDEEKTFTIWLRSMHASVNIVAQHWLTSRHENFTKCYDVFVPDQNLLIEFDGTYWHNLDRDPSTFDWAHPPKTLLVNLINDMKKNRLARERGLELIRIASDVDYRTCASLDELKSIAYHHQLADGTVIRQGTYCLDDDRRSIITREQLIRINEPQFCGPGRQHTQDVILPFVREFFREHALTCGWFYPIDNQSIDEALSAVCASLISRACTTDQNTISSTCGAGTKYLKSHFKSYWHVDRGPVDAFWNDEKFTNVLMYRLGLNNSKMYDYTLHDGTDVSCHETFDINIKNVRFGLIVQRNAVSFFKPHAAACIYDKYLNNDPAVGRIRCPIVWDPSCGFGARLLGFAAVCPDGTYLGTEPASQTFSDIVKMTSDVRQARPDMTVDVTCTGSELDMSTRVKSDTVDLVFTSPPYFDKERYFDEPGQCWRDYPDLASWRAGYLLPTFTNAFRMLKSGRQMIINIDDKNVDTIVNAAREVGFTHVETLSLKTGRDHFNRKNGYTTCRIEPMLVFVK